jgi:hypothetical protein
MNQIQNVFGSLVRRSPPESAGGGLEFFQFKDSTMLTNWLLTENRCTLRSHFDNLDLI